MHRFLLLMNPFGFFHNTQEKSMAMEGIIMAEKMEK